MLKEGKDSKSKWEKSVIKRNRYEILKEGKKNSQKKMKKVDKSEKIK